jgi:cell wall-associated NlpC family hydrolase
VRKLLGTGAGATTGGSGTGGGKVRRWTAITVTLIVTGGAGFLGYSQTARAEPAPSVAQVQAEVNSLQSQIDQVGEQYDKVTTEMQSAQAQLTSVEKQEASAEDQYNAARKALKQVAIASYEEQGQTSMAGLLSAASPQAVLQQASLMNELANMHSEQADLFLAAAQKVASAQAQFKRTTAGIAQLQAQLASKKDKLNSLLAKSSATLATVTQQAAAATLAALSTSGGSCDTAGCAADPLGQSTAALKAVYFAYQQLGKPYEWGATGPDSFDCSGLTQAAYAYAGISIPRDTYGQVAAEPAVSESDLEPGDLLFFEGDGHVGIYVGDGLMIDAPATGQNVTLHPTSEAWYAANFESAARPS